MLFFHQKLWIIYRDPSQVVNLLINIYNKENGPNSVVNLASVHLSSFHLLSSVQLISPSGNPVQWRRPIQEATVSSSISVWFYMLDLFVILFATNYLLFCLNIHQKRWPYGHKTNSVGVEILPDSPNHLLTGQESVRRDNLYFFSKNLDRRV